MITSTYERSGMRISKTKILCAFAGDKHRVKEREAYLHTCNHAGCPRNRTWCTENWREAEIKCPWYNVGV